jgi:hypothetical protein
VPPLWGLGGRRYVKFTADAITEFLLLSFKEKDDE